MAALAANTRRIKIGSAVINAWTRNPATLAATFLTLDDLAPDRILFGLGPWWDPLAAQVGVSRTRPLLAVREIAHATRTLLMMQPINFHGQVVQLSNFSLEVYPHQRRPRRVPIYIGATGPKLMALGGEIADGVLLSFMVSPAYNHSAISHLEVGARKAGRSLDSIDRPQLIACALNPAREKALDKARRLVTRYLRQQPQLMRASGIRQELLDEIAQILPASPSEAEIDDAARLVPDEVVQTLTASGTPEECYALVQRYLDAGATRAVLYPLDDDVTFLIDRFAHGYTNELG
jgi:5,10-methylenetetrahydromethanopterin reductase